MFANLLRLAKEPTRALGCAFTAVCILLAPNCKAQSYTYSGSAGSGPFSANSSISWDSDVSAIPGTDPVKYADIPNLYVRQFDPTLGGTRNATNGYATLTGVSIAAKYTLQIQAVFVNTCCDSAKFAINYTAWMNLTFPDGTTFVANAAPLTFGTFDSNGNAMTSVPGAPNTTTPYELDIPAKVSGNWAPLTSGPLTFLGAPYKPADLSPYIAPPTGQVGTVVVHAVSDGSKHFSCIGGTCVVNTPGAAAVSLVVTYTYTLPNDACKRFVTYTQSQWGQPAHGHNVGDYLADNFDSACPGGITIGVESGNSFLFNSSRAISVFLPQSHPPATLPIGNFVDPKCDGSVLWGQLLAVKLAVAFSKAGISRTGLGSLSVQCGPYAGKTVNQVVKLADNLLAGTAIPAECDTLEDLNKCLKEINRCFDNGSSGTGFLK